jgi:hypothetical protein
MVVLVNAALGVALIGVIASVSMTGQAPHPNGLAEFAPAGGKALSNPNASAAPTTRPQSVRAHPELLPVPAGGRGTPRQVACYGWPDGSTTQTIDPQSPPCITSWNTAGGNGGATSRGITGTAVRVGVFGGISNTLRQYAVYFTTHFQLYGRSLQLVDLGKANLSTVEGQQAAADEAVQQQVFAALITPPAAAGPAAVPAQYLQGASAAHVITLLAGPSQVSTTTLAALAPYAWSYEPAFDQLQTAAGSLVCQTLAGRLARYSAQQAKHSRRVGVLVPDASHAGGNDLDIATLTTALEACHSPARVERFDPTSQAGARDALLRLKVAGVTTVLPYAGSSQVAGTLMPAAESLGYRPEWVLTGIDDEPDTDMWATAPAAQTRSLFGLADWSRRLSASLQPAAQGLARPADADVPAYHALLVLASGIQLAGPRLTATSFGNGLASTAFPNPGAGRAPAYQASVGFDDSDHTMVGDVALSWWQPAAHDFCLVGTGSRWRFDGFPDTESGLFDPAKGCR